MNKKERETRDADVLRMFLAGATYRQIREALNGPPHNYNLTTAAIHKIVQAEIEIDAQRRQLLTDEAGAITQQREERLFQAHWTKALKGDPRSSELCRRMLDQQVARRRDVGRRGSLVVPPGQLGEPDDLDLD